MKGERGTDCSAGPDSVPSWSILSQVLIKAHPATDTDGAINREEGSSGSEWVHNVWALSRRSLDEGGEQTIVVI